MAKNDQKCIFGLNLAVFGTKILIITVGSKGFGSHVTEKSPRNLDRIVFWLGMGPNGPKMPIFGQKSQFWAKLSRFWPKILIFMGISKRFGTQITEEPPRQLFRIVYWSGMGPNGPKMPIFGKKCKFCAKFGRFLAKNPFFGGME